MKKILLVALVTLSLTFMTTEVVYAEGSTTAQAEQQTLKPLDSDVLNALDDEIHINKRESEVNISPFDNNDQASIEEQIINKVKEAGYDTSSGTIRASFGYFENSGIMNIHKVTVAIFFNGKCEEKEINIVYSNTASYSQADEQEVKNKVSGIKLNKYWGEDAVFTVFSFDDKNAEKWDYDNYDYNTLLNDSSIKVRATVGEGGTSVAMPRIRPVNLYFYKNDILYETKSIVSVGTYGFTLNNGTPVEMLPQKEDTEVYKEMAKKFINQGLKNIIGCYELEAYGDIYSNMEVAFKLGDNYNGKGVKILHKKSDGSFEEFITKIENGIAKIKVNEFSPFMIALTDEDTNATQLSNNAQTSSLNTVFYSVLSLISLVGILTIVRRKKDV